jgi:RNA methyltransferase, TrmH family
MAESLNLPSLSKNRIKFLNSLKRKKVRDLEGLYIIEGVRICEQAISVNAPITEFILSSEFLFSGDVNLFVRFAVKNQLPVHTTPELYFNEMVETETPQGIAAVVRYSKHDLLDLLTNTPNTLLALDRIQDPGNLGTIIRTAEWFGVNGILAGNGTVDIYNPKVIRSAMGALFKIPVVQNIDFEKTIPLFKKANFSLLGSTLADTKKLPSTKPEKSIIFIGSEAHGLDEKLIYKMDYFISIPGTGSVESLNAAIATGIILYEFTGNRI